MKKLIINGKQVFFFIYLLNSLASSQALTFTSELQFHPSPRVFHSPLTGFTVV